MLGELGVWIINAKTSPDETLEQTGGYVQMSLSKSKVIAVK